MNNRNFFDSNGICLIGQNTKGKHWSEINASWCDWAKKEIKGFAEQLLKARKQPKAIVINPTGRRYILKKIK
jgi:hypothetical protein